MWTEGIDIFTTRLLRLGSKVYFGCGAIGRIDEVLEEMKERGIHRILFITGRDSYRKCGAREILKDAFTRHNIHSTRFDKATGDPTGDQADKAAALGRKENVQGVLAMGGGSVLDTGKLAAALLAMPEKLDTETLFAEGIQPDASLPLAVINLTHGTGSEVNPFAILSIRKQKPLVSSPLFYPDWAIDDPMLTCSLPVAESKFVTMAALNSAIESATAKESNVLSIMLARETVQLIVRYLPLVEKNPQDLTARYFLMYASLLAGVAYDNSHHDLDRKPIHHPVSFLKPELHHGQSISAFLPAYIKEIYPRSSKALSRILHPISPELTGKPDEAQTAALAMENWLTASGLPRTLQDIGFVREDIDALVEAGFQSSTLSLLLTVTPTEGSKAAIRALFDDALTPCNSGDREEKEASPQKE